MYACAQAPVGRTSGATISLCTPGSHSRRPVANRPRPGSGPRPTGWIPVLLNYIHFKISLACIKYNLILFSI